MKYKRSWPGKKPSTDYADLPNGLAQTLPKLFLRNLWMVSLRKLRDDLADCLTRFFDFLRLERDRADDGVPAATISLTNLRDVVPPRLGRPWIRSDRDLRALWPARQRHRVSRLRIQVVRDELVEAFVTLVNQIKLHHAVRKLRLAPHGFQRL